MGPQMSPRLIDYETDIEMATRWWGDYPRKTFGLIARPKDTYSEFLTEAYQKPKRLVRSASATRLTYIKEAEPGSGAFPIHRSPSVSSLSPSHVLPYYDRVPYRYFPSSTSYRPSYSSWFNNAYSPSRYQETHLEVRKPPRRKTTSYTDHTYFFTRQANKSRWDVLPSLTSYLRGSQRYMDSYVINREKAWDFALPLVYNSYEYSEPSVHRFNRHLMLGSKVFVNTAPGIPKNYGQGSGAWHPYRMYKFSNRVLNV